MSETEELQAEPDIITVESPLAKWPGALIFPSWDEFNGVLWQSWRQAIESQKNLKSVNRLYAYAGAEFAQAGHVSWEIEGLSLAEFIAWRDHPIEERLRLVSWVGKSFQSYMREIIDPKG